MLDVFQGKEFWDLDSAEKIRYSQIAKDKGGDYFKVSSFLSPLFSRYFSIVSFH